MSCWHKTAVLRIPATALGFRYKWQWDAFLKEHDDEFQGDPGTFTEALCDDFPSGYCPFETDGMLYDPNRDLTTRDPNYPELVTGPFLDYIIEDIYPLHPEHNTYGEDDAADMLTEYEREDYLPLYQELFPDFTLEDMEAVHYCKYEWYDGSEAAYRY